MRDYLAKGLAALAVYALAVRPWHLRWGATEEECRRPLPGDAVVSDGIQSTRANHPRASLGNLAMAHPDWPRSGWLLQL